MDNRLLSSICTDKELPHVREWLRNKPVFPIPMVSFKTSLAINKLYISTRIHEIDVKDRNSSVLELDSLLVNPPRKCLIDISGKFASGKTQMLLKMAATFTCVYIGTEDRFRLERFKAMGGQDIYLTTTYCQIQFISIIENLDDVLSKHEVRAIVIDSMHLIRDPLPARHVGKLLLQFAVKYDISVVFVNQVRSSMSDTFHSSFQLENVKSITPVAMNEFIDHKLFLHNYKNECKPIGFKDISSDRILSVWMSRTHPSLCDTIDENNRNNYISSRCKSFEINGTGVVIKDIDFK